MLSTNSTPTAPTHDQLGRLALEYLAGAASCALPSGAAWLAFARHRHLEPAAVDQVRAVVAIVERAEARAQAAA